MGSTSKSAWTGFERAVSADLSTILVANGGEETHRVPLSGMNSRHNAGDVIIPAGFNMLYECKYRSTNAQHTLYKGAVADAVKTNVPPLYAMLCTKVKRDQGYLVTMDKHLFWRIMQVPGVLDVFRKNDLKTTQLAPINL